MSVQTIEIFENKTEGNPSIRLGPLPLVCLWQFAGSAISDAMGSSDGTREQGVNKAVQIAATELAKKVSNRRITVDVVIEPLMPLVEVDMARLLPIVKTIGENASASVEPGPGSVQFRTWWRGKHAGIDAIGIGGILPDVIRKDILTPGFTTRVADWDTGFGLHDASLASIEMGIQLEMIDTPDGVGFRMAIPLKRGRPASPPEAFAEVKENEERILLANHGDNISWDFPAPIWNRSIEHVERSEEVIEA